MVTDLSYLENLHATESVLCNAPYTPPREVGSHLVRNSLKQNKNKLRGP
jgi:hypothetical protein